VRWLARESLLHAAPAIVRTDRLSINHAESSTSWIALLEMRDRLIAQLRHDVPAVWPSAVGHFLDHVKAVEPALPSAVALLLLADLARELDRLAPCGRTNPQRQRLLTALDGAAVATISAATLCRQFEEALSRWCERIKPDSLIAEVQSQRVATYIDQHFAEHITLMSLARMSGWCTRPLSRAFRSTMHMSIRQYLQQTRIDHAAARLREGDKVESVVAAVGWRGRKNFFSQFKRRVGTTPARYRECWVRAPAVEFSGAHGSVVPSEQHLGGYRARRDRVADPGCLESLIDAASAARQR
jgi:AraC-like DNA-binding protein